jgi:hypothetical protein
MASVNPVGPAPTIRTSLSIVSRLPAVPKGE